MQTAIVTILIGLSLGYLALCFLKALRQNKGGGCGCGDGSCSKGG